MLNTNSLRRTFRGFCENNGLSTMLYKCMDNEGTMKPQYVTGDNGIEHDHKQAMALHRWNKPEPAANAVYNGQHISMRFGTPPDKFTGDAGDEPRDNLALIDDNDSRNPNDRVLTSFVP
eukprot:6490520-Amphidinium_carterae.1